MKKNKFFFLITLIMISIIYTSCGSTSDYYGSENAKPKEVASYDDANNYEETLAPEAEIEKDATGMSGEGGLAPEEKLIVTTDFSIETEKFDVAVQKIENMTKEYKGYIEQIDANYGTYYDREVNRRIRYSLRIPKGNSSIMRERVKNEIGQVVNENMSTENVTKRIKDYEREIQVSKAKEDRLLELTQKTDDIEALIKLETELAQTIADREYREAELQNLEHNVSYDYLYISLQEVRKVSVIQEEKSFIGDLKIAFSDSIYNFIDFLQNFAIFIARNWISIIVFIIIILLLKAIINKLPKRKKVKKTVETVDAKETGESIYKKQSKDNIESK
ncbi:MAG: DUF4349 domain-containing protein [Tissierellia bacterium]|nr:DUF4349 domain-containing protein [Tissierellia bacterium]